VSALRFEIASAHDSRATLSDRYARMKAEHRALLRSRAASIKGVSKAGVAREAAMLIGELEAHLLRERRENVQHARQLNEKLYMQEQKQCDLCAPRCAALRCAAAAFVLWRVGRALGNARRGVRVLGRVGLLALLQCKASQERRVGHGQRDAVH
jgi:hypothetical protein